MWQHKWTCLMFNSACFLLTFICTTSLGCSINSTAGYMSENSRRSIIHPLSVAKADFAGSHCNLLKIVKGFDWCSLKGDWLSPRWMPFCQQQYVSSRNEYHMSYQEALQGLLLHELTQSSKAFRKQFWMRFADVLFQAMQADCLLDCHCLDSDKICILFSGLPTIWLKSAATSQIAACNLAWGQTSNCGWGTAIRWLYLHLSKVSMILSWAYKALDSACDR